VAAIDDTSRATLPTNTWTGLNANATPFWTSRTNGLDEIVTRISEATSSAP
jgi:hypothetical protein